VKGVKGTWIYSEPHGGITLMLVNFDCNPPRGCVVTFYGYDGSRYAPSAPAPMHIGTQGFDFQTYAQGMPGRDSQRILESKESNGTLE
jgi:hypothetical protein